MNVGMSTLSLSVVEFLHYSHYLIRTKIRLILEKEITLNFRKYQDQYRNLGYSVDKRISSPLRVL